MICKAINAAWSLSLRSAEQRFVQALRTPRETQLNLLTRIIQKQAGTTFFKDLGLNNRTTIEAFRNAVPPGDYTTHEPYIDRIRLGETNVLTTDRITHLIPTSGSSGPRKLIPHTAGLQRQFDAALGPWVRDLTRRYPDAMRGRAYWSVSPAMPGDSDSPIPIGFEDDTAYLGPIGKHLVRRVLAVPSDVRHETNHQRFWLRTLTHLLCASDLSLISVWHPSFMLRLLDELEAHWDKLIEQLPNRRAKQLRFIQPHQLKKIWPGLTLVSAWADASASLAFERMSDRLLGIPTQPKGLLASECWTTIPYASQYPLALNAHFFEFINSNGKALLCNELTVGETYETVVTTAGGLYRYQTGDRVRITGHLHQTPTLTFIGRDRDTSDICGEKINETHVIHCLQTVYNELNYAPTDQALAPADQHAPTHYRLMLFCDQSPPERLADRLDAQLKSNPHYELARRLGQLGPLEVCWCRSTQRPVTADNSSAPLGAIKPATIVTTEAFERIVSKCSSHKTPLPGGRG